MDIHIAECDVGSRLCSSRNLNTGSALHPFRLAAIGGHLQIVDLQIARCADGHGGEVFRAVDDRGRSLSVAIDHNGRGRASGRVFEGKLTLEDAAFLQQTACLPRAT